MLNSLNVAQTGLSASKIAVENVSNNIANENTPGYKKRVVQLDELELSDGRFTGRGVQASESYRITSQYLYDNIMKENTKNNYYEEMSSIVGNVEKMFQETDEAGFSKDLDRYFKAVENLRSNPNSEKYRSTLKLQGTILVESMQSLYSKLEQQEDITRNRLEDDVSKINSILHDIVNINKQIEKEASVANELLDKRDKLEKDLSNYVNIEVDRSNGYELKIGGSVAVRNHNSVREINLFDQNKTQLDRFAIADKNNIVYDSLKYTSNDDGTVSPRTYNNGDVVTYKLDNTHEVSVTIGDHITDANGKLVDLDGDSVGTDINGNPIDSGGNSAADIVTANNFIRALSYKINHDSGMAEKVNAFNGNYSVDDQGHKIDTSASDKFLVVEALADGTDDSFIGRITITHQDNPTAGETNRETIFKDDYQSVDAEDSVVLAFFEEEIEVISGAVKAQLENLNSTSPNNKIANYKNMLDNLANSLSDINDTYVKEGSEDYIFGDIAADLYDGENSIVKLSLFNGSDVKSLNFNESSVNELNQDDLEYLSKMQWKKDIDFDGLSQDASTVEKTSFSEYFQEIKLNISSDKGNNDFFQETQGAVVQSLEFSYDKITKVDRDEEMINLIKFQAAYSANAKIITVVDEMLQTLLNIR